MRAVEANWYRNFLYSLSITKDRYDTAIKQSTSGKKLLNLSDNPSDMAYVLSLRGKMNQIDQFEKNINSGLSFLSSAEGALNSTYTLLHQVASLAAEGSTESTDAQGRQVIADNINEIRDQIMSHANTEVLGKFIFAGSMTQTEPFTNPGGAPADVITYNGNAEYIFMQADFSLQIESNLPGSEAFSVGVPDFDVFEELRILREALLANDTALIADRTANLHNVINGVDDAIAKIGNRISHFRQVEGMLKEFAHSIQSKMSQLEDADMAEAISNLAKEEVGLQSTLQSGARIQRISLMNFLG